MLVAHFVFDADLVAIETHVVYSLVQAHPDQTVIFLSRKAHITLSYVCVLILHVQILIMSSIVSKSNYLYFRKSQILTDR